MELITDNEAEQRVISAILHSDTACIEAFNTLTEDTLYRPLHKNIWSIAARLYRRGIRPTFVELVKEGYDVGLFAEREDVNEIQQIAGQYIEETNLNYWLDRVNRASKGRKAQALLEQYTNQIESHGVNIPKFIREISADFMALAMDADTEIIETAQQVADLGERLVNENVVKWRQLQEESRLLGEIPLEGVATGIPKLNDLTLGYKPGDLIILGAQTGHGKTAFALNTAMAACVNMNRPILYVNTEMSKKQIAYRWGAILSQMPLQQIRTGSLRDGELYQVLTSYKILAQSGFYTSYMPNLTPDKLQMLAKKAKMQFSIEMLVLDYVGRMEKIDPKLQEWQVLEQIVKAQKLLAQNLDIACMVLVQLNEDGSLQGAKRMKNECDLMLKLLPMCDDLKDEAELAHSQEVFERKYGGHYEPFNYRLWVDKSRDSEGGMSIPLVFDMERQQIRQAIER